MDPEQTYQELLGFRTEAKNFQKCLRKYIESTKLFSTETETFSSDISKICSHSSIEKGSTVNKYGNYFSKTIFTIHSHMKSLAEQMSTICEKTFTIFSDFDYYELQEGHKDDNALESAIRDLEEKRELHFLRFLSDVMRAHDDYCEKSAKVYTNLRKKIEGMDRYLADSYPTRPAHEGIVYTKGGDKYMMILKGSALRRFRERDFSEPPIDVITCSVRVPLTSSEEDVTGRFRFELMSPKIPRSIVLYTDTEAERAEWSRVIQDAITLNLSGDPNNVTGSGGGGGSVSTSSMTSSITSSSSSSSSSVQRTTSPPPLTSSSDNGAQQQHTLSPSSASQMHMRVGGGDRKSVLQRSQSVSNAARGKRVPGQQQQGPSPPQPHHHHPQNSPLGRTPPPPTLTPGAPKRRQGGAGIGGTSGSARSHSQDPPDYGSGSDSTPQKGNGGGEAGLVPRGGATLSMEELRELRSIPGNNVCAECGASNPEWAVINQGILICLECSGVHRSLGTHVSKVRSLLLDKWLPETLLLIKNIGNTGSKAIFERKIEGLTNVRRLHPGSDRPSREEFIRNKYVKRMFVDDDVAADVDMTSPNDVSGALFAAVSRRNGENVARTLIKLLGNGADVNFSNAAEEGKTPLFQTLVRGNLLNLEILLLNGADVTAADERGWLPFHYAAFYNRPRCMRRLMEFTKGKIPQARGTPLTPFDVAVWNHSVECIRMLRGVTEPAVEFTFGDVLNSHNSHEDVFTIPQRTQVPPKEMCSKIPKVRVPGCPMSKSSAGLPQISGGGGGGGGTSPPLQSSQTPSLSASSPSSSVQNGMAGQQQQQQQQQQKGNNNNNNNCNVGSPANVSSFTQKNLSSV